VARAGSLEGTVDDVEREGSLRVLSRERDGQVTWAPGREERIEPGDRVTVIGTQVGLAGLSAGTS
jgi:Trk K+ transport system NAD-binding subunit